MNTITIPKKEYLKKGTRINPSLYLRKDWRIWQKLAGIWRSKRLIDPVRWQRKIRREA